MSPKETALAEQMDHVASLSLSISLLPLFSTFLLLQLILPVFYDSVLVISQCKSFHRMNYFLSCQYLLY